MKRKITLEIIQRTHKYLGEGGRDLFKKYKEEHGTVSPVLYDGLIPHPVHFREGMQIRNFLRTLDDCKDWTDHDFDDTWSEVIERVITL